MFLKTGDSSGKQDRQVNYKFCIHHQTFEKIRNYQDDLAAGSKSPGRYFKTLLEGRDLSTLAVEEFLELLVRTKKPQIFAESQVYGDGSDWNSDELSILGDVGVAVPVTVFDDGRRSQPRVHTAPFPAELLFIPGALLAGRGNTLPVDRQEVVAGGQIGEQAYFQLYERRLLPLFVYANTISAQQNKQAFITLPGIGCGYFAGSFKHELKPLLQKTLLAILQKHIRRFANIRAVYFDPDTGLDNTRHAIGHLSYMVRPLLEGNHEKPQLCPPQTYAEADDDFSSCQLFSIVAWDHVSWPGNDFYKGSRVSDDGVKAAATSSMASLSGIQGMYNSQTNCYAPPARYQNWEEVVLHNQTQLEVRHHLLVVG